MIEKLLFGDVAKTELDNKQNGHELNGHKRNGCKQNGFKQNQTEILLKLLKKHDE